MNKNNFFIRFQFWIITNLMIKPYLITSCLSIKYHLLRFAISGNCSFTQVNSAFPLMASLVNGTL
jgi:hypothetical protein